MKWDQVGQVGHGISTPLGLRIGWYVPLMSADACELPLMYTILNFVIFRRVAEIQIFEKTCLIVIKDETGLKFKMSDSTLFLIGSYAQKLVASY